MTTIHIYNKEDGKYMRSQEPKIDVLESQMQGKDVYVTYPNSTDVELPEYAEHELPFFVDGAWVVKGQYKNIEVYNTESKNFEYCYTEELGENQVFIDDKEGIKKFKSEYKKYIVDENTWTIVENPKYPLIQELNELNKQFDEAGTTYDNVLNTPVEFPQTGKLYKPRWVVDGTYGYLAIAKLAGWSDFPIEIWDTTKLEENKVSMDEETFEALCAFLLNVQREAYDTRKYAQAKLVPEINELKEQIGD